MLVSPVSVFNVTSAASFEMSSWRLGARAHWKYALAVGGLAVLVGLLGYVDHRNVENIMWSKTLLTEKLGIRYPIIQAPLAGGIDTPRLVAAVSNAGGLGSIGAAYLSPDQIRAAIREVRRLSDRPFAVNLFAPEQGVKPTATPEELERVNAILAPYHAELGLPVPSGLAAAPATFDAQFAIVVEERVPIFSFTAGVLPADRMRELKALGIAVLGTATTIREGVILAEAGVDAIVAQGSEAGGHRASFASPPERALIGTMSLVPRLVDRTGVPVIAAGGIMDGRGVVAALSLGAMAVQMGSAFVTCTESGANEGYKRAMLNAGDEDDTTLTRVFSGRMARGRRNRFVNEMDTRPDAILPYPLQNGLTKDIRQTAAEQDVPDLMPLWSGQGPAHRAVQSVSEFISKLVSEAEQILARLQKAP